MRAGNLCCHPNQPDVHQSAEQRADPANAVRKRHQVGQELICRLVLSLLKLTARMQACNFAEQPQRRIEKPLKISAGRE